MGRLPSELQCREEHRASLGVLHISSFASCGPPSQPTGVVKVAPCRALCQFQLSGGVQDPAAAL